MADSGIRGLERRASGGDTAAQQRLGLEYLRLGNHQIVLDTLAGFQDDDSLTAMSTSIAALCEDTPMLPPSEERLEMLFNFTEKPVEYHHHDLERLYQSQTHISSSFDSNVHLNFRAVAHSLHDAGEALLPLWAVLQGRSAAYRGGADGSVSGFFSGTATDMWVAFKGDKAKFVPRCWSELEARWNSEPDYDFWGYFTLRKGEYDRLSGPELPRSEVVHEEGFYKKDIAAAKKHLGWIAFCEGKKNVWEEYVDHAFEHRTKQKDRARILQCIPSMSLLRANSDGLIYAIGLNSEFGNVIDLNTTYLQGAITTNRHRIYALNKTPVRR